MHFQTQEDKSKGKKKQTIQFEGRESSLLLRGRLDCVLLKNALAEWRALAHIREDNLLFSVSLL